MVPQTTLNFKGSAMGVYRNVSYVLPDRAVHSASSSDRADRIEISIKMASQLMVAQTMQSFNDVAMG